VTIDQVDERLKEWVQKVLDIPAPSLTPPSDGQEGRGVSLYLLEMVDRPPPRTDKRPPLRLSLRYLVTTWAEEPEEAHRMLGELAFAAMENPELEAEVEPIPIATWAAFGVAPRPSFILQAPLRKELPERPTKYVLEPIVVKRVAITALRGVVLGPDDIPIGRALVEIPTLRLSARTNAKGQFTLSGVPSEPPVKELHIRAKGQEFDAALEHPIEEDEPIVVRLDLAE